MEETNWKVDEWGLAEREMWDVPVISVDLLSIVRRGVLSAGVPPDLVDRVADEISKELSDILPTGDMDDE